MIGMRSFWRRCPPRGAGCCRPSPIQTLGRGLTLPFTIIYLHEVRGFDLGLSGALMSLIAIAGLIVTGPGGSLTDRYGARAVLLGGLAAMIAGNDVLAFATDPAVAAVALVLIGINFGVSWPAFNALIAAVVRATCASSTSASTSPSSTSASGSAASSAGSTSTSREPSTFTAIFLVDAASALIPMALLLGPLRHVRTQAEPTARTPPAAATGRSSGSRRCAG